MRRAQLWAALALALAAGSARAACPNKCSGHGTCGANDVCTCMQNWQSGDCSERVCPFTRAWQDTASASNAAHYYAECGNRGACDRDRGACDCDEGFTGSGCRRLACPNDCSGHGTCEFIEDLAKDTFHKRVGGDETFLYTLWDQEKIMGCVCDPGFEGHDCALRMCPRGDDVLTPGQVDMKQALTVNAASSGYVTYFDPYGNAFTTDTVTFAGTDAAADCALLETALRRLPNNALNNVEVSALTANYQSFARSSPTSASGTIADVTLPALPAVVCQIEFPPGPGTTGYQHLLGCNFKAHSEPGMHPLSAGVTTCSVVEVFGAAGAGTVGAGTRELTELDVCSGRGQCDQTTGLCKCYTGHIGLACQSQEALV